MSSPELQQTLGKSAALSGTSLHTGEKVTLKLHPAPVDHGLKFRRKDLQDEPTISALIDNLKTVERATTIGEGSVRVHTVEHVVSALAAMGVDNAIVEMDANEPPIGDGSAVPYVELIKRAGVMPQEAPRRIFEVREPIHVETNSGSLLVVLPDEKFRISCTQVGPNGRFAQFFSTEITPAIYEREIAAARTFVFYEDVQPLMEKNLIKGGSLENAIVVRGDAVLSKEPLRFPDEFVRHKILDIIGVKSVSINEPFFAGHFPAHPVMPGVLQLEAMAQVASILMMKLTKSASRLGYFISADSVKFRKPVMPGDTLFIHAELTKARSNRLAKAKCYCAVNEAVVSEGELMFTFLDK